MSDDANALVTSLLPRVRRSANRVARVARKCGLRYDPDECESRILLRLTTLLRRKPYLVALDAPVKLFDKVFYQAAQEYLRDISEPNRRAGDRPLFSEVANSVEELDRVGKEPDPSTLDWDGAAVLLPGYSEKDEHADRRRWVAEYLASGIADPREFARLRDGSLSTWQMLVKPSLRRYFAKRGLAPKRRRAMTATAAA